MDAIRISRAAIDTVDAGIAESHGENPSMRLLYLMPVVGAILLGCVRMCDADEPRPVYRCPKITKAPVIDGKLDDEAWKIAPAVRLSLADTGKPATKRTIARMCWDDENLYISFDCDDEDLWNDYKERDDPVYNEEVVEAFLSPECDLKHYYEINVSPRNVVFDASIFDPINGCPQPPTSTGWDCVGLRTAVVADGTLDCRTDKDKGYIAELAIPFAGLGRKTPKPGERWRGNLYRIDLSPKPAEFQSWSPTLVKPVAFHVPDRFGTIFFVD